MSTRTDVAPAPAADDAVAAPVAPQRDGGRHRAPGTTGRSGLLAFGTTAVARSVLSSAAMLLLWTLLPALAGWQSSLVLSGSMAPSFEAGDVAVVRPVEPTELRIGQALLVDDPDRPGELRLHRLVDVADGRLVLKGDANLQADSSSVDPGTVHGVVALRIPMIGLPAVWWTEGRHLLVTGAGALLLAVLAAAGWHRPVGGNPLGVDDLLRRLGLGSVPRPSAPGRRSRLTGAVGAGAAILVVASAGAAAAAPYLGTVASPGNSLGTRAYYTCANAAYDGSSASPGTNRALRYYPMQETSGTTAANLGSAATADGTYVGTPVFTASGPTGCGASGTRGVTLDGSTQWVNTLATGAAPTTFSVEIWFKTSTANGGRLIGFGNETRTNGQRASVTDDRHLYMTSTGKVAFGVLNGATKNAVVGTRTLNDGAWHHAVGTLSSTGMTLYVDGTLEGSSTATTSANAASYTGAWRIGYDVLTGWSSAPPSAYFAGTVAHGAVYSVALSSTQVGAHYRAGT